MCSFSFFGYFFFIVCSIVDSNLSNKVCLIFLRRYLGMHCHDLNLQKILLFKLFRKLLNPRYLKARSHQFHLYFLFSWIFLRMFVGLRFCMHMILNTVWCFFAWHYYYYFFGGWYWELAWQKQTVLIQDENQTLENALRTLLQELVVSCFNEYGTWINVLHYFWLMSHHWCYFDNLVVYILL